MFGKVLIELTLSLISVIGTNAFMGMKAMIN